jgi:hypothetical protein
MRIYDKLGIERDWAWVQAKYGPVAIEDPSPPPARAYYEVVQLLEVEGIMAFQCSLVDDHGAPVAGQRVVYSWPGALPVPGSGWDEQGLVEITTALGVAEHGAGTGEAYVPPVKGPASWYVYGPGASQRISGMGWLAFTNHDHLQVTMRLREPESEPQPQPEPTPVPADDDERWQELYDKLDVIIELLEERA